MMLSRLFIPAVGSALFCASMYIGVFGQEVEPPPVRATPARGERKADTGTALEDNRSVEELIQATIEILDEAEDVRNDQGNVDRLQTLFDQASQNVQLIQERDAANAWLLYLRGRGYSLTDRPADAAEQLRQFVETREGRNEWRAYRSLGDLFSERFPRLANANYQKAAALKANEPNVLIGLSKCHLKFGDTGEAIRFAREAIQADGRKTPRYVSHLASVLQEAERWDEALSEAESAVQLARKRAENKPGLRGPLRNLDTHYELLIEILQNRIARAEHGDSQDYIRLVRYTREKAQVEQTLAMFDLLRIVQLGIDEAGSDKPPDLLEQYAILLAEVGRTDDAVAAFEELLQADPGNPTASQWLKRLKPASPDVPTAKTP